MAEGELAPGERLPSVRRLAAHVGLSPGTVAAGTRGAATARSRAHRAATRDPHRSGRRRSGSRGGRCRCPRARATSPRQPRSRAAARPRPRSQASSCPRVSTASLRPCRSFRAGARTAARGRRSPASALCVVSGALDGIERVLQAHLRPGDRIAVENPGYAALYDLLRAQGLVLEPVRVDDRGMRPGSCERARARRARCRDHAARAESHGRRVRCRAGPRAARGARASSRGARRSRTTTWAPWRASELHTTIAGLERWAATRSVAKALGPDLRLAILTGDAAHRRSRAGTPAMRPRLGQPHPAEDRAGAVGRPRCPGADRSRERDLRRNGASASLSALRAAVCRLTARLG